MDKRGERRERAEKKRQEKEEEASERQPTRRQQQLPERHTAQTALRPQHEGLRATEATSRRAAASEEEDEAVEEDDANASVEADRASGCTLTYLAVSVPVVPCSSRRLPCRALSLLHRSPSPLLSLVVCIVDRDECH